MQECHTGLCLSVYVITFILGLPANVLAFYTFCKKVREKPAPIDILLLNLTISDLLFLVFLPFKMQEVMNNGIWQLPYVLCPLSGFIFFLTIYNSTFCLTAISVERYLGVAFPIQHTLKRRPLYAVGASIFFWIFSILHLSIVFIMPLIRDKTSPENLSQNSSVTTSTQPKLCYEDFTDAQLKVLLPVRLELCIVLFCIPLLICCFCYINFIRILSLCFGPYNVSHIVGFIQWKSPKWRDKALLCSTFNACLDPLIFYFSSSAMRGNVAGIIAQVKRRLCGCTSCGPLDQVQMDMNDRKRNSKEEESNTN
uniref:G-protein coupled receptors family 1 profile domain-containing protein n=1 Tax=Cynoglossus semilaevis TaxID=244447 RepID=A0A3P8UKF9_CYNSE